MIITETSSPDAVLLELGLRLAGRRLERNLTQAGLAREAGVSPRTLQRLERGEVATQLAGFIRVCRVLGLLERFEALIPAPMPSPMAKLKLRQAQRRRASTPPAGRPPAQKPWHWGNEP
jgi:transcriptional regulator with XRE-family HTH domain